VFYLLGFVAALLGGDGVAQAVQFGASLLIWGVFVRTVVVWHITWSVNSAAHIWGYRTYDTGEQSRNNWFVALISNGEGWHNNHHADSRSARHGHQWWEIDVVYMTIRLLEAMGLARNVLVPDRRAMRTLAEK
jgi:stearoyl-CoA desaturase (delta-9 desaturase)